MVYYIDRKRYERMTNNMSVKDLKDVLIARLPKKYQSRVKEFYYEEGLIDDCMYMLHFTKPYVFCECPSVPVKNLTEAISFTKEAYVNERAYE